MLEMHRHYVFFSLTFLQVFYENRLFMAFQEKNNNERRTFFRAAQWCSAQHRDKVNNACLCSRRHHRLTILGIKPHLQKKTDRTALSLLMSTFTHPFFKNQSNTTAVKLAQHTHEFAHASLPTTNMP